MRLCFSILVHPQDKGSKVGDYLLTLDRGVHDWFALYKHHPDCSWEMDWKEVRPEAGRPVRECGADTGKTWERIRIVAVAVGGERGGGWILRCYEGRIRPNWVSHWMLGWGRDRSQVPQLHFYLTWAPCSTGSIEGGSALERSLWIQLGTWRIRSPVDTHVRIQRSQLYTQAWNLGKRSGL